MIKTGLIQQQVLQMKLNPALLQSINILQFSSMELVSFVKKLAEENPLIEHVDDYHDFHASAGADVSIGEINAATESMYDQLKNQLVILNIPEQLKPVVEFGIDSLNENGYLDIDLESWQAYCSTSIENVKSALTIIQSLDPAGIGARNLTECVMLQLRRSGHPSFIEDLLTDHLEWIAAQDTQAIATNYQIRESLAEEIIAAIKQCHPKPGQLLSREVTEQIIPEAKIYKQDGTWKISFYQWSKPEITINDTYRNMNGFDKETKRYLQEKYREISLLKQAIAYRTGTLEKILTLLLQRQIHYLEEGPGHLKPVTMQEIADLLQVHVSTISRAVSNKYIETNRGMLPVKYFFPSGVPQKNGQTTTASSVKHLIQQIVEKENKQKALSDEAIKKYLFNHFGISIARRTIVKYRKQLQIPSSVERKKAWRG